MYKYNTNFRFADENDLIKVTREVTGHWGETVVREDELYDASSEALRDITDFVEADMRRQCWS